MSSRGQHRPSLDGAGEPVRVVAVSGADAVLAARLLPLLSDAEQSRAAGIRAAGVRVHFVVARAVLRDELARVLGCLPVEVPLSATSTGKLVLEGGAGFELSVTHTDGLVLVGWHPVLPLGIDAERADRAVGAALVERVSTDAERVALDALPASSWSVGLLRLWVRKEAVAKAEGRGLALALSDLEVLGGQALPVGVPAPGPLRVRGGVDAWGGAGDGRAGDGQAVWVRDLEVGTAHLAAVATIGGCPPVAVEPWSGGRGR